MPRELIPDEWRGDVRHAEAACRYIGRGLDGIVCEPAMLKQRVACLKKWTQLPKQG